MSARTYDVVIAGGGIVGAACAEGAARRGLRVLIVEPGPFGGGATAAGMGHLVVIDDSEAQFALTRHSLQRWDALREELPPSVEFQRRGTVWIASDAEEMATVRRKHAYFEVRGVSTEILDERALYDCEPNLAPGMAGGLLVPGDSVIYPPCAARWMIDAARRHGAHVLNDAVVIVRPTEVQLRSGPRVAAPYCVAASGIAAANLVPNLPIRPRKGHLLITDRYPELIRHQLVELGYIAKAHGSERESIAFNAQPRATGQILLGSSRQFDAADPEVEWSVVSNIVRRATRFVPRFGSLSVIRIWTGHRAATPDSLPLIGPAPDQPALIVAAGHEGLGVTTSLGTADLVVARLIGDAPPISAEPFLPSRFAASPADSPNR